MKQNILMLTGLVCLAACSPSKKKATADTYHSLRSEVVETTPVEMGSYGDELTLNGDVSCDERLVRKVFIPCSGRVSGLSVEVGDQVRRGQCLAVIHSEEAADYNKGLADADAQIRLAERDYEMKQDMRRSGMASDKEVGEARAALVVARAERSRLGAVAGINGFGGRATAVLRSPISGYANGLLSLHESVNDTTCTTQSDYSDHVCHLHSKEACGGPLLPEPEIHAHNTSHRMDALQRTCHGFFSTHVHNGVWSAYLC